METPAHTKTHTALVAIEKPFEQSDQEDKSWLKLKCELRDILKRDGNIESLSETLLEIPLKDGLFVLSQIVVAVHKSGLRYRVLFFGNKPEWVIGPSAKQASGQTESSS